ALQALDNARQLTQQSQLTADNADEWLAIYRHQEQEITEQLLDLEQKISVSQAAVAQFEQALSLISALSEEVTRQNAWQKACDFFQQLPSFRYQAQQYSTVQQELNEVEQRYEQQQQALKQFKQFCKRFGQPVETEALPTL